MWVCVVQPITLAGHSAVITSAAAHIDTAIAYSIVLGIVSLPRHEARALLSWVLLRLQNPEGHRHIPQGCLQEAPRRAPSHCAIRI